MATGIYIKPEIEVMEVEAADMLAVSSIGHTTDEANDQFEALTNNRRGKWGDLWSEM